MGVRAQSIDRQAQKALAQVVASGWTEEVAYDACVLCTGSYPCAHAPSAIESSAVSRGRKYSVRCTRP
eukprot:4580088-Lingulodinium_polyedra.AAC.1